MRFTVFNKDYTDKMTQPMFLGTCNNVLRFDEQKYPVFERLRKKQLGFFWQPEEVDVTQDKVDFAGLSESEQHIFTANIKLQTLADSMAGRAISVATISAVSLPELETWYELVAGWESAIHASSYSHIIRGIYDNPTEVFDSIINTPEIVARAAQMGNQFDELIEYTGWVNMLGFGRHTIDGVTLDLEPFKLKCLLYKAVHALYILEGVRFYASFACSFAFVERKLMDGNGKILKLIARDENLHAAGGHAVISIWNKGQDDPEMLQVMAYCRGEVFRMYNDAEKQEHEWADYLFSKGTMLGINAPILKSYISELIKIRMRDAGLIEDEENVIPDTNKSDVLPWMHAYISSDDIQVAPQETEITSYLSASTDGRVSVDDFEDFDL
jgi:ribonucleoside-diphosphate reductase beta chain